MKLSLIVRGQHQPDDSGQHLRDDLEPRADTRGNASQQRTRRAQDRESVSQALQFVRNTAKQRKKEQFTVLFHHLSPAMLRTAFLALKRDAAPGIDRLTWQDYEADLNRRIEDVHERVHGVTYQATITATIYTEAGWPPAPARYCRPGRQDRPEGNGRGAE